MNIKVMMYVSLCFCCSILSALTSYFGPTVYKRIMNFFGYSLTGPDDNKIYNPFMRDKIFTSESFANERSNVNANENSTPVNTMLYNTAGVISMRGSSELGRYDDLGECYNACYNDTNCQAVTWADGEQCTTTDLIKEIKMGASTTGGWSVGFFKREY